MCFKVAGKKVPLFTKCMNSSIICPMADFETSKGLPYPLGAKICQDGVNFAVFSRNATLVILNIYSNEDDNDPCCSIKLETPANRTGDVWHVFVKGLKAGALYLYQVDGPFEPEQGFRFNAKQLLFDPYAKALTKESIFRNLPPNYKTPVDKTDVELAESRHLYKFPKCVVVDDNDFDWEDDTPINRPLSESIIYETHVKGFTAGESSGVSNPGTYDGFIQKIPYLKDLGITSVELMPVFEFDEFENNNVNPRTGERMKNYWGYSTVSFFAPKATYAADKTPGGCVKEFKRLVKEMHKAGLEVILDVVFNHTAEGNEHGITLNFRGFDNNLYYILVANRQQYYMNYSGCGNTVNCNHPVVRNFILECLRYWVLEYHIDGFRFDLASILTRSQEGYVLNFPPLTNEIAEDPVLHNTKIIAEPWDAGGAYQLGCFPGGRWAEWNDRFRDDIRRFWRGDEHVSTQAATRISGSSDLYAHSGRKPYHSINYVCCHDGFTMNDLVSYNGKHNEQNGEGNRDGSDSNWSYNNGYEGPTANPMIERQRNRMMRNFILTTLISQGTPMLLGGDEFRRTQQGNNNAYCQDSDISYFNWNCAEENKTLVEFTRRALALRKAHPALRRNEFFLGEKAGKEPDIRWYSFDGANPDWEKLSRFLAFSLGGSYANDNDFYIAANPDRHDIVVTLPHLAPGKAWYRAADTSIDDLEAVTEIGNEEPLHSQTRYVVPAGSMVVLISK